jgi:hypothetical protein
MDSTTLNQKLNRMGEREQTDCREPQGGRRGESRKPPYRAMAGGGTLFRGLPGARG